MSDVSLEETLDTIDSIPDDELVHILNERGIKLTYGLCNETRILDICVIRYICTPVVILAWDETDGKRLWAYKFYIDPSEAVQGFDIETTLNLSCLADDIKNIGTQAFLIPANVLLGMHRADC